MRDLVAAARLGDRALFPDLEARSFLAHAAVSPPSVHVRARVDALLGRYAAAGVGAVPGAMEARGALRQALARLIGAEADDIGLVAGTSAGIVWIAHGIPWRRGDRVVLVEGEFPANVTPWQQAARTFGLEVVFVPAAPFHESADAGLAAVEAELRRGARLVSVSAVRFQDGLRMPTRALGALAHRYGAELCVDAIQALGVVPTDVRGVDYLACGAHKWLMGLEGAGFVYVARARIDAFVPRLASWLGHEDPLAFLFAPDRLRPDAPLRRRADVVEQGALSNASLVALAASLELLEAIGIDAIDAHVQRWHDALEPSLAELGLRSLRTKDASARSGSLCASPPPGRDLAELARSLGRSGVVVSTPDGNLRFAPHWPNALDEVPLVVDALRVALR